MDYEEIIKSNVNEYRGIYPIKIIVHARPLARVANISRVNLQKERVFSFLNIQDETPLKCDYIMDMFILLRSKKNITQVEIRTLGENIDNLILKGCADKIGSVFLQDLY